MTAPITRGAPLLPSSPPGEGEPRPGGAKLLSRSSPGHRLPVIDKSQVDPRTIEAAQGMEAMFLDYMMKVMRQTVPKSEMDLESPATEIYRGMLDSELTRKAAHAGGIGLADQIIAYLESRRYNQTQGAATISPGPSHPPHYGDGVAANESTGGTFEGQPHKR